jgi:hypothetical protein
LVRFLSAVSNNSTTFAIIYRYFVDKGQAEL